jgi:hypothetical protein
MIGFYNVLDTIKTELLSSPFCSSVTFGDINEVDLSKRSSFPLSHFIVDSARYQSQTITFTINLICMDIVDISKEDSTDLFIGNDNEQDVLNTQLQVIVNLLDKLKTGQLYSDKYQLDSDPTIEPFTDRFDNKLAGWAVSIDVNVVNDNSIC